MTDLSTMKWNTWRLRGHHKRGLHSHRVITNDRGFQRSVTNAGFAALKVICSLKSNLIIMDYQLPHMDGLELYDQL